MYRLPLVLKLFIVLALYSLIYFEIHIANFRFISEFVADFKSIYFIFYYAIVLIFSIISGFIIQSQWHKSDTFIDSIRGEVNMLRHLYTMAHQFPKKEKGEIRLRIYNYLVAYVHEIEEH